MVMVLFDTNILVDYLNGIDQAEIEINKYPDKAISIITWMEVLVGATQQTESVIRSFLNNFKCLSIDNQVGELAIVIRKKHRIKLPDAIVRATAQVNGRIFITRDTKDFPSQELGIHIPYQL